MYNKILIPIDGSESSVKAVHQGSNLAVKYKASITLFHVVPVLPVDRFRSIIVDEVKAKGKELLEQTKRELSGIDVPVDTELVPGHPSDAICLKAGMDEYDLIVIGSRGLGGVKGYLLGSVSSAVARHARCSVLIVR